MSDFVDKAEFLKLPDEYEKLSDEYSVAYSTYKYAEDIEASVLADLIADEKDKAIENKEKYTITELKVRAQASQEYKDFLESKNLDRQTALRLEGKMKALNMKFEAMRSVLSAEKNLTNMSG